MKQKTHKKCKECGKEFKLFRTTDKYCGPVCAAKNKKPMALKKPINKVSEKRKIENFIYSQKRKNFLMQPDNQICPVCFAAFEGIIDINKLDCREEIMQNKGLILTDSIHHIFGRRGKFLNIEKYWLAVSDIGHRWIHSHPKQAYELGFLGKNSTINL